MKNFKDEVKNLSAKELILTMVESLGVGYVNLDMSTFGKIENDVAYGCVATNTIIHIMGSVHEFDDDKKERWKSLSGDERFVMYFETAIDALRKGNLFEYNIRALGSGFAYIKPVSDLELPVIDENYTKEDLEKYICLANNQ